MTKTPPQKNKKKNHVSLSLHRHSNAWRQREHVSVYSICLCASGIKWYKWSLSDQEKTESESVLAVKSNVILVLWPLHIWIWLWSASDLPHHHLCNFPSEAHWIIHGKCCQTQSRPCYFEIFQKFKMITFIFLCWHLVENWIQRVETAIKENNMGLETYEQFKK